MLTSNSEDQDIFVELLDDEAKAVCGGTSTLSVKELELAFQGVKFNSPGLSFSVGQGLIELSNVTASLPF